MSKRTRSRFPVIDYTVLMSDFEMKPAGVPLEHYRDERKFIVNGVLSENDFWDTFQYACPTLPEFTPDERQLNMLMTHAADRAFYDELNVIDEGDFYGDDK